MMSQPLEQFFQRHHKLMVITGAGCSTDSGIPDYRDDNGQWKRSQPILYQEFMASQATRQRYWARSYPGWLPFSQATPNPAHIALAFLESQGRIDQLVTQNVDGLHQRAGSRRVIDLHGRLEQLCCQHCGTRESRHWMQQRLAKLNPGIDTLVAAIAPDGDAELEINFSRIAIPGCRACGGILKPDVVFYGEQVPRRRIQAIYDRLHQADALLVIGTSLMVFSAFQFVREATRLGKPVAAINLGKTRADPLFQIKVEGSAGKVLTALADSLFA